MACFIVPATEAVVTTIVSHVWEAKAKKKESAEADVAAEHSQEVIVENQPFYKKINWLSNMLWGGSALLAFEHVWHGEVEPWFPFLTAAKSPDSAAQMIQEMSTVGVAMAVLVTAVWMGMVAVSNVIEKRADEPEQGAVSES